MVRMIINSSYEVISLTPFCKTQNREMPPDWLPG